MTRVKICGLMNKRDIEVCVQAGVHMLGFVVDYPVPVPWNITKAAARVLIDGSSFVSTCVVTGVRWKSLSICRCHLSGCCQLHYKETLQDVKEVVERLNPGIKVIKALRIDADGNCDFEITTRCGSPGACRYRSVYHIGGFIHIVHAGRYRRYCRFIGIYGSAKGEPFAGYIGRWTQPG